LARRCVVEAEIFGRIAELNQQIAALEARIGELESQSASEDGAGNGVFSPSEVLMDIGGESPSGAFQWDGETITQCYFQFGRAVYGIADQQASGDGTYYLSIPHDTPATATVSTTQGSNDLTKTVIPLFKVEGGEITKDYRGMPVVPVRE
jgi:hypothetical protein